MPDIIKVNIRVPLDAEGFLHRRCPFCAGEFKLRGDDVEGFDGQYLTCACCGLAASFPDFTPEDVLGVGRAHAMNHGIDQISRLFKNLGADLQRTAHRSGGAMRVTMSGGDIQRERIPKLRAITDLALAELPCCETAVKLPFSLAASLFYCPLCGQAQD